MSGIRSEFENALKQVRGLRAQPSNADLLKLYALYKQATVGDVRGARPGRLDVRDHAKYSAWEKARGLGAEEAMARYAALVAKLVSG